MDVAPRTRISVAETRCAHADVIVSVFYSDLEVERSLVEVANNVFVIRDGQGSEALRGKLLGSGPILKKIDLLVAEIAWMYVLGFLTLRVGRVSHPPFHPPSVAQKTVVTVAFDTFKLLRPVFHGDFVRLEGRALSINKSSVVCQASVYRRDFASGEFQLTHNAIVTFVAIDKSGRACGGLPELFDPQRPVQCKQLRELAEKRKELSARWRKAQEDVAALAATQRITHDMIPALDGDGAMPARLVDIQDTVVETRNNFLLKHANLNRNVFGGVLLDWMVSAFASSERFVETLTSALHLTWWIGSGGALLRAELHEELQHGDRWHEPRALQVAHQSGQPREHPLARLPSQVSCDGTHFFLSVLPLPLVR